MINVKYAWIVVFTLSITACEPEANRKAVPAEALSSAGPTGTMPIGANVVGASGELSFAIPEGYYDGSKLATAIDSNLLASNIASGISIFGVTGTAGLESHVNCTANGQSGCVANATYLAGAPAPANFNAPNAIKVISVPQGYYDGTKTITAGDANLVAGNVRTGTSIFGITGSLTPAYSSCSDNALNAGQCSTAANRYVASAAGSNVSGANASLSATIPQGFYDGTKSCAMSDTNLVATNIVSGHTIFGVAGSATASPPACISANETNCVASAAFPTQSTPTTPPAASDVLSGKQYYAGGAQQTGTMINQGAFDASASFPGTGFYDGTVNHAPAATQICSGTSVLGTPGSAICGSISFYSNAYRDEATMPISQTAETTTYAGADLPAGYRAVPSTGTDDDGYQGGMGPSGQVTYVDRSGFVDCGTPATMSADNIAGKNDPTQILQRIAHCADVSKNGANATWDGAVNANAGQGVWKLVTRSGAGNEVWQDQRTGLLWSSKVSTGDNWCQASGNTASLDSYCTPGSVYQPLSPTSWCAEEAGLSPRSGAEDWSTGVYLPQKGGMGKVATASSPSVRWRLPTKYDYQGADNNGIRFVLPGMADTGSGYEWTATVTSNSRTYALSFNSPFGDIRGYTRGSATQAVRCVGR